jgi:hypothetical protein
MGDIAQSNPNFPPVVPLDKANQHQKGFFPYEAFSADDPNTTNPPTLTLKSPWKFSALMLGVSGSVPIPMVQPLSSAINANTTYNLPSTYPGEYIILIPAAYLKASSGGPYTLTIQTPAAGTSVKVPISASGDTILSGNLLFEVYVDASGNVTSDQWQISGSNTNGTYVECNDGTLRCRYRLSIAANSNATWTFPVSFIDTTYQVANHILQGAGWVNSANENTSIGRTTSGINFAMYPLVGSAQSLNYDMIAEGRWM